MTSAVAENLRRFRLPLFCAFAFALATTLSFLMIKNLDKTAAADLSRFNAGDIMSDDVMLNYISMDEGEIQNFLKSKNSCNNTNVWVPSNGRTTGSLDMGGTMNWHVENGHFVCMADERFDGESAAHIIWQAAQDYRINPQVLIVLLEKEQGLVTDTRPRSGQYRSAAGYGCPDTAACDAQYYGFKNQVRNAASLFRYILDRGSRYKPVGDNYIQYSPNSACGGSIVNIKNRATSALYQYTPYQPNAGALAAGYGTASCGAYGNRNFYAYFTDWFGDTHQIVGRRFIDFDNPRYMRLTRDIDRIDPFTGQTTDHLEKGRILKYTTKIFYNGKWYYRTENNTNSGLNFAVDSSALEDVNYEPFITPRYMRANRDITRVNPFTGQEIDEIKQGRMLKYTTKICIAGKWYYRTENNTNSNLDIASPADMLDETAYIPFDNPRELRLIHDTNRINPFTGQSVDHLEKGRILTYDTKILYNGKWYYRTENNTRSNLDRVVPAADVEEVPKYIPFDNPRYMHLSDEVTEYINPYTGERYAETYNRTVKFDSKIKIDDKWYYRPVVYTLMNANATMPADKVSDEKR